MKESMTALPQEVSFVVQGKQFAGELWGDKNGVPVIALHGWLDNCHSFRVLAPLLESVHLLALDMAGHGHSDHRSPDASYHIWDDVREILMIAHDMGWHKFALLGHSRGAIIAAMIAAVAPERVTSMVLLEGLWPQTIREDEAPAQLSRFVQDYLSFDGIERGTKNFDELLAVRMRGALALDEVTAHLLVERNVEQRDGCFYWRTDPRLRMPSPLMLTAHEADSFIQAIQCSTQVVLASAGLGKKSQFLQEKLAFNEKLSVVCLEGGHHFHLNGNVRDLAERVGKNLTLQV